MTTDREFYSGDPGDEHHEPQLRVDPTWEEDRPGGWRFPGWDRDEDDEEEAA